MHVHAPAQLSHKQTRRTLPVQNRQYTGSQQTFQLVLNLPHKNNDARLL